MIGHLQRNKAARAVELFDVIHTVDSVPLAAALARRGEQRGKPVRVLIEVNTGGEARRAAPPPAAVDTVACRAGGGTRAADRWLDDRAATRGVGGSGAPALPGPARAARSPAHQRRRHAPLRELSMGMTDDFEVAIEEGATMVRVGRAIFGERTG